MTYNTTAMIKSALSGAITRVAQAVWFERASRASFSTHDAAIAGKNTVKGELFLPTGTYAETLRIVATTKDAVSIIGEHRGTVLQATSDGGWAIEIWPIHKNQGHFQPIVERIVMSSTGRKKNGIFVGRQTGASLRDLAAYQCLIGFLSSGNFYGVYENLRAYECDVGFLFGTYESADGSITDLVDADGATTTVVPDTTDEAEQNGHAGNKALIGTTARGNRIGIAHVGATQLVPEMTYIKPTVESNDIGLLVTDRQTLLIDPWFENNGTTGTLDFNGETYPQAGIVVTKTGQNSDNQNIEPRVNIVGGKLDRIYVGAGASVSIDGNARLTAVPTVEAGGGFDAGRVQADNLAIPYVIRRPSPLIQSGSGRGVLCYAPMRSVKTYAQPIGGEIVVADDCAGSGFVSSLVAASGADATFEVSGGVFGSTCLQLSAANGEGLAFSFTPATGYFYVLLANILAPADVEMKHTGLSGFWPVVPIALPANRWVTTCTISKSYASAGVANLLFNTTGEETIKIGGLMVARFAASADAAAFVDSSLFHMTEA